MTQEEKAKAYDEALKRIENLENTTSEEEAVINYIFPQLHESEDDRIRKELLEEIEFIIPHDDETDSEGLILPSYHARIDRYKSYLEKHKEPKPVEWEWPNLSNCIKNCKKCQGKCFYRKESYEEQKPAEKLSKEEYVKKFKALCDAYEIKLPNREYDIYGLCEDLHKLFGDIQNPAEWSEEDKVMLNNIIWGVHMKSIKPLDEMDDRSKYERYEDFLKALPERFNLQPRTEWSEEDENRFRNLIYLVEDSNEGKGTKEGFVKFINRLKSLRPNPHWKPSEYQMKALKDVIDRALLTCRQQVPLESLYNELNKLFEI